ncbi:MAG: SMC-Scp complex subunit ScpB [Pseudomonadales bacterium]|nr:SMC-Scp complex subunit ScpB [Pseudomonadales bacterium]
MNWENNLKQIVEGAILASESPLSLDNLMSLFDLDSPSRDAVRAVIKEIEDDCATRGFELKRLASGYRFQVKADYGEWVSRLWEERPQRYTRALLETLALVAYKQPITRGDIEAVRGVTVSTNIIRSLLEREWIRIVGHRDVPGRPAMYATTKSFLDYFNLVSLDELPTLSEIKDLDAMTDRLALDEPLIEMKTIELDVEEVELEGMEETDLDEVSTTVDTIKENIRRVMAPAEVIGAEEDDEAQEDEAALEDGRAELSPSLEAGVAETDGEKTDNPERFDEPFESMKDDQEDILRAAFADDAQDPVDSNETTDQGS